MLFNRKDNMTKFILRKFKESTDPGIHLECGFDSMNNICWVNLVENGEKIKLRLKPFKKFFEKGLIRGADGDNIKWLTKDERFGKTEKVYKCVVMGWYLRGEFYNTVVS